MRKRRDRAAVTGLTDDAIQTISHWSPPKAPTRQQATARLDVDALAQLLDVRRTTLSDADMTIVGTRSLASGQSVAMSDHA